MLTAGSLAWLVAVGPKDGDCLHSLGGCVAGAWVPQLGCPQAPPMVIQALLSRPVSPSQRRAPRLGPRWKRCPLLTPVPPTHSPAAR